LPICISEAALTALSCSKFQPNNLDPKRTNYNRSKVNYSEKYATFQQKFKLRKKFFFKSCICSVSLWLNIASSKSSIDCKFLRFFWDATKKNRNEHFRIQIYLLCFKGQKMADSMLLVKYLVFLQQIFNQSD